MGYEKQTSIDKPQCPNGHGNMEKEKEWTLRGKHNNSVIIALWRCPQCRASTRIPRKPKGETTQ